VNSKEREDTSGKVEYEQYAVFTEQWGLDDLNYSESSIRDEA